MAPTRLITFEGGEAVGKSTQIELLARRLKDRGEKVLITREPGGTPLGESIRHLLKHAPEGRGMCQETELLLFLASRAELVRKVIVPALDAGTWVLCDRFLDSTTIYQGVGRRLPMEIVSRINAFAAGPHLPGLTLLLDLEPEQALTRLVQRTGSIAAAAADRMEEEPPDFHARVRQGYRELAKAHPERIRVVSAAGSVEETADAVWLQVSGTYFQK